MKSKITVIILTFNEERHIQRCIERIKPITNDVFVVDCFSDDRTKEIAEANGAIVVQHKWPGNQAEQFNWALENLPIKSTWVLRLDADEYLYKETLEEIKEKLSNQSLIDDVTSFSFVRDRTFMGQKVKYGCHEIELVRMFRFGYGHCERKEMDERIITYSGRNVKLKGHFIDDSLISFEDWKKKHINYAEREARQYFIPNQTPTKNFYYKLPPYFRSFAYFCYRYFLCLGFLDGVAGLRWNFWQGLWYRCLVDYKIGELKKIKNDSSISHMQKKR